jgi:hypothetical protein
MQHMESKREGPLLTNQLTVERSIPRKKARSFRKESVAKRTLVSNGPYRGEVQQVQEGLPNRTDAPQKSLEGGESTYETLQVSGSSKSHEAQNPKDEEAGELIERAKQADSDSEEFWWEGSLSCSDGASRGNLCQRAAGRKAPCRKGRRKERNQRSKQK